MTVLLNGVFLTSPNFRSLVACLSKIVKYSECTSVNEYPSDAKSGLKRTVRVLNVVRGIILSYIIATALKRQAIVSGLGIQSELQWRPQNVMFCVGNVINMKLLLLSEVKEFSSTAITTGDIAEAVDVMHVRKGMLNIGRLIEQEMDEKSTHVNVLWSCSWTRLRSRRVHQFASRREALCGPELDSTDTAMVGSSCREWTPLIKVYQTTNAKNMLAKVASFLRSLVPTFDLNFAPVPVAA